MEMSSEKEMGQQKMQTMVGVTRKICGNIDATTVDGSMNGRLAVVNIKRGAIQNERTQCGNGISGCLI